MSPESKDKLNGKIRSVILGKDTPIFLFFLLLATIFWFIQSLDKQRTTTLKVPIQYVGIPDDIELEDELPNHLEVRIRDEGMMILNFKKKNLVPLALDFQKSYGEKGRIVLTPDQLKNRLGQYVFPSTAILKVKPDSIAGNYFRLKSKTVPIKLKEEVKLSKQYVLSRDVEISPTTVKVFGPKNVIDTLSAVYTEAYDGKAISSDSTYLQLGLENTSKQIKLAFENVTVGVFIEMFTENKIEVPITLINVPKDVKVRVFPSSATITYNVKMSDFSKVSPKDLQVYFDYNEAIKLQKREYPLDTQVNSQKIWSVRTSPKRVEFLFEKN